ncbi:LuxR C-terminal-related transcriptional regulator [Streptomyces vinaceus]|uniref:LuxR C-terminal-related transcriptional regulator n=1 Tax=Streptomyces vinaceus TaxID=1960 RepID=UPI0036AAD09C
MFRRQADAGRAGSSRMGRAAMRQADPDAARALHLSEATITAHVSQITANLHATNRVQIVTLAHQTNTA